MFWKRKKDRKGPIESLSPRDHLRIAGEASARAEWTHALGHLALALEDNPTDPEARALLDRVLRATRDPLRLVPLSREAKTPYQIGAVRAYIHAWHGQLGEAVYAMAQVYRAAPGLPYLPWLVEWLSSDHARAIEPKMMGVLVTSLLGKFSDDGVIEDRDTLERLVPALAHYCEAHPQAAETACIVVIGRFFCKLGRVDEALATTERVYKASPNYYTAVALGAGYRAKGNIKAAVGALRDALSCRPEDLDARLDIGDLLCGAGQVEAGLVAYQEVLDREPNHPWALSSYFYYKSILEPRGQWQRRLGRYAAENPDNALAQELNRRLHPYVLFLPEPSDATINFLRCVAEQEAEARKLNLSLSALESPSARLAVELYQAERFGKANFTVDVARIQRPDPRVARGSAEYVLWYYEGTEPWPAVGPPSRRVAEAVAALAARPYHAKAWFQEARSVAAKLGAKRVKDLLGAMVRPPKRPAEFTIWVWIQRVQVAAAFVIAWLDGGWMKSLRRRVLFSLACGPMDWTVEAAIVALMQVAREEPATAPDIAVLYLELFDHLPKPGGVPYLQALLECSLRLPPLPIDLRTAICLQRGVALSGMGDFAGALADYDEAIRLDPGSAVAYNNRGIARRAAGDCEGAIADYDEAIRLDPRFAKAYNNRGIARREEGDREGAIADYDEAVRLDPRFASAYNNRGLVRKEKGDYDGAIADYSEAIQLDPEFAKAYNNRGNARSDRGNYDGAIADYDEAIRLDPQYAKAYSNRGNARSDQGDYDGAIVDYDEAVRLDPRDAVAHANRGATRGKMGDAEGAAADFNEAIRLDPQLAIAYVNRGAEYVKKGNYERAITDCTTALRLDPGALRAYVNRSAARCELGDYDGAIADCNEALRLDPRHAAAYGNRGYAYLKKGDHERAISDCDVAIRLRPFAYFYNNRGQARGALGDYAGAVADLREALRLMPSHPEAEDMRAKITEWSRKL